MELYRKADRVAVALVEEGDWSREDLLLSADSARWAADGLDRLATRILAQPQPAAGSTDEPRQPSIEVECIISNGKPLVRWVFGWREQVMLLTPAHALALARVTRLAAIDAAARARWIELREPAVLIA